jgi:AbiV family abortive infection protein
MKLFSITECRSGFDAALENAKRFYDDALPLKEAGRLLSATLLAIYAYGELGKAILIARALLRNDRSVKTWREFE